MRVETDSITASHRVFLLTFFVGAAALCFAGCGFVGSEQSSIIDPPGLFLGVWHGLIAPYTLIIRWFIDIKMYSIVNSGWFYDFGFLIGICGSIPIGWICAIIALVVHFIA